MLAKIRKRIIILYINYEQSLNAACCIPAFFCPRMIFPWDYHCRQEEPVLTEKELRKLSRYQLLELLIIQTERANSLQKQLEAAQQKLNRREIEMTVVGSIAEASMKLSGVFEAAQRAAEMYLEAAQARINRLESELMEEMGYNPDQSDDSPDKEPPIPFEVDTDVFLGLFRNKDQ